MAVKRSANGAAARSADERYQEFRKESERWNRRVKSAISELDKAARSVKRGSRGGRNDAAAT